MRTVGSSWEPWLFDFEVTRLVRMIERCNRSMSSMFRSDRSFILFVILILHGVEKSVYTERIKKQEDKKKELRDVLYVYRLACIYLLCNTTCRFRGYVFTEDTLSLWNSVTLIFDKRCIIILQRENFIHLTLQKNDQIIIFYYLFDSVISWLFCRFDITDLIRKRLIKIDLSFW